MIPVFKKVYLYTEWLQEFVSHSMLSLDVEMCVYIKNKPVVVAHACNPRTREAEAGESSQIQNQPGLHGGTLSQRNKIKLKKEKLAAQ